MPPFPLKWKIFRIANYVHTLGLVLVTFFIIHMFTTYADGTLEDYIGLFIFIVIDGILLTNTIINWILLDRCYPDKYPTKKLRVTAAIILFLASLVIGLLLFIFCYGIYSSFIRSNQIASITLPGFGMLIAIFVLVSTGICICWLQVLLRKTIHKNYKEAMDNFLVNASN